MSKAKRKRKAAMRRKRARALRLRGRSYSWSDIRITIGELEVPVAGGAYVPVEYAAGVSRHYATNEPRAIEVDVELISPPLDEAVPRYTGVHAFLDLLELDERRRKGEPPS